MSGTRASARTAPASSPSGGKPAPTKQARAGQPDKGRAAAVKSPAKPAAAARLSAVAGNKINGKGSSATKMGARLAEQIEQRILELGWPVGHLLGSEPELIETYGVSRAVLREAIRLLEHAQVAEMRRGRNGGLFVTEPDPAAIADSVALFLRYRRVTGQDLFDVRQTLELTAARLAAQRSTEEEVDRLRALTGVDSDIVSESAAFHDMVAEISGNPAIHLFVQILTLLTETMIDHSPAVPMAAGVHHAHAAIADAVEAANPDMAHRRMLRHFEAMTEVWFRPAPNPEALTPDQGHEASGPSSGATARS